MIPEDVAKQLNNLVSLSQRIDDSDLAADYIRISVALLKSHFIRIFQKDER